MAVTYGFYDSLNHDRLYNAQQMSAIFDGIINDGVFMSVGNQFHTVAGTGMQVIVKSGRAWFDSTWTLNDAEYPLSIDAADVLLTRIDAVVLEVNSEVATRANTIKVVKGTPASTPAKPTLTNTATIHQHALAYVTVAKNITAISNSMIEIVVGKTETPYVTAILQTTDITDLYNQWEDYFQTWFDTVRGTLDGDVALNLQNQITTLRRDTLKSTTPPIIGLPSSATPDDMFQALAKTGDLYVWKKTVVDKPAGYNLSNMKTNGTLASGDTSYTSVRLLLGSSVFVSLDGNATVNSVTAHDFRANSSASWFNVTGKFIKIMYYTGNGSGSPEYANSDFKIGTILYVPSDGRIAYNGSGRIYLTKYQIVTSYKAETTITYPVSTNPNAYQEGNDGTPARYVLGEVENGTFSLVSGYNPGNMFNVNSTIEVTDAGAINFPAGSIYVSIDNNSSGPINARDIVGKFISLANNIQGGSFEFGDVWFIPSDVAITGYVDINKRQHVTAYAAIPANTIIEFLGKLGDRGIDTGTYIGTGAYGENTPNSITFTRHPRLLFIFNNNGSIPVVSTSYSGVQNGLPICCPTDLSESYELGTPFAIGYEGGYDNSKHGMYGKYIRSTKTLYWYSKSNSSCQLNQKALYRWVSLY